MVLCHTTSSAYLSVCSAAIDGIVSIVQRSVSTLSSVIITLHENYMILPVMGVSAASVYYTVLDIKRVENEFFHSMYIFSVIFHAIDKQDIST